MAHRDDLLDASSVLAVDFLLIANCWWLTATHSPPFHPSALLP